MTRPDDYARRVQDFESLPQYIAARQAERDAMIARHARWLRTWGRAALLALALLFAALLASHAAPKAIASFADPLAGNPY